MVACKVILSENWSLVFYQQSYEHDYSKLWGVNGKLQWIKLEHPVYNKEMACLVACKAEKIKFSWSPFPSWFQADSWTNRYYRMMTHKGSLVASTPAGIHRDPGSESSLALSSLKRRGYIIEQYWSMKMKNQGSILVSINLFIVKSMEFSSSASMRRTASMDIFMIVCILWKIYDEEAIKREFTFTILSAYFINHETNKPVDPRFKTTIQVVIL